MMMSFLLYHHVHRICVCVHWKNKISEGKNERKLLTGERTAMVAATTSSAVCRFSFASFFFDFVVVVVVVAHHSA